MDYIDDGFNFVFLMSSGSQVPMPQFQALPDAVAQSGTTGHLLRLRIQMFILVVYRKFIFSVVLAHLSGRGGGIRDTIMEGW